MHFGLLGLHMNDTRLVLVMNQAGQWEDKTREVATCADDPSSGQVRISYKTTPTREYSYGQGRVRLLAATGTLNPVDVQLRVGGRLHSCVDSITKFPDFYLVVAQGVRTLYAASIVREERDVTADSSCGVALEYFRAIAELVSVRNDEDQSILAGQYKQLSRVPDASVLAAYLKPDSPLVESDLPGPLIYPFGTNASQKAAVEKAFRSQVTIVQGPPGTGKTQTIVNMVANAIRFGQTVAVVSNNNAATKNVASKLEKEGLGFLLATLGRRANKTAFIKAQGGYPAWLPPAARCPEEIVRLEARMASLTTVLDKLIQANNDRAMLVLQITQTRLEAELHRHMTAPSTLQNVTPVPDHWTASDLLALLVECDEIGPDARPGLLNWLRNIYLHGLSGSKVRRQLLMAGPVSLRSLYYDKHLTELQAQLVAAEGFLAANYFQSIQQEVEKVSWELLRASIAERFTGASSRPVFAERELWSKYSSFVKDYPVVLSTTHSLKTSLSPDCLYDLVIIDEASQVDVATGVLALSCGKRAVIVGDDKQLPNVISEDSGPQADEVWARYQPACQAWNYTRNSLLSSAVALWPHAPSVLLREHYRCHPKIVGFINHKFYANQLITMTADHGEPDVMQVMFTVPGNHARGRINQRQIDVIIQEILPSLREGGVTDIGIISPYRDQVEQLRNAVGDSAEVDTVHGFQGREKLAIVVSTVDNQIGDFADDAKLLNVAVSRAQRRLIIVMADGKNNFTTNFGDLVRYIRHHQQLVTHSKVHSVFDLLYSGYESARRDFLRSRGKGSIWDSENLAEAAIHKVLGNSEFAGISLGVMRHVPLAWLVGNVLNMSERERKFVTNPWSHIDLLIYDTIGKLPLVCIEVDGWAFHRPGSLQAVRDEIKNAIFQSAGLQLIRLSTAGSGEAATIASAIRQAIGLTMDS